MTPIPFRLSSSNTVACFLSPTFKWAWVSHFHSFTPCTPKTGQSCCPHRNCDPNHGKVLPPITVISSMNNSIPRRIQDRIQPFFGTGPPCTHLGGGLRGGGEIQLTLQLLLCLLPPQLSFKGLEEQCLGVGGGGERGKGRRQTQFSSSRGPQQAPHLGPCVKSTPMDHSGFPSAREEGNKTSLPSRQFTKRCQYLVRLEAGIVRSSWRDDLHGWQLGRGLLQPVGALQETSQDVRLSLQAPFPPPATEQAQRLPSQAASWFVPGKRRPAQLELYQGGLMARQREAV